jgi:hypothetical protein
MKHILIIDDRQLDWSRIALSLRDVNARISIFTLEESRKILGRGDVDLIILGEESHRLLAAPARHTPILIISEDIPRGETIRARGGRSAVRLGWPVSRKIFTDLTSRILAVPERRPFQTPVLIGVGKGNVSYRGNSEDFSLGGMSFTTAGNLEPREGITVSFGGHDEHHGLRLEADVVRRHLLQDPDSVLYGARFRKLTKEEQHALERFVWRIPKRGQP